MTKNQNRKRVLLIAYGYPPRVSAGVHRIVQFAKYLPDNGWEPFILTAKPRFNEPLDFSPLTQLEVQPQITRTFALHTGPVRSLLRNIQANNRLRPPNANPFPKNQANSSSPAQTARTPRFPLSFNKSCPVIRQQLTPWVFIPDRYIGWLPFAVSAGIKLINEKRIDVIFSSFKPATSLLVGYMLHHLTGKPWIADFRDPWTYNSFREDFGSTRWQLDRLLQRHLLRDASAVSIVTEPWRKQMLSHFSEVLTENKIFTIMNGFDPHERVLTTVSTDKVRQTEPARFRIVYTGAFYEGKRDPTPVFQALRSLIDAGSMKQKDLVIEIAGPSTGLTTRIARKLGLQENVKFLGLLSRSEAIDLQRRATVLLLVQSPDNRGGCPGKIFEYLAARRPILALTHSDSVAAQILNETRSGAVVPSNNPVKLKDVLCRWYNDFVTNESDFNPDDEAISRYGRDFRTRQLATLFDRVSQEHLQIENAY